MCHLLGFRFAPRIRDLADKRLYVPGKASRWTSLSTLISGSIRDKLIEQQFAEVLRLAASIQKGTMTASLILRKLGPIHDRIVSLSRCVRSAGSSGLWPDCKTQLCAAASPPVSINVKPGTR